MESRECPGCRARDVRIAELEQRNAALERRLAALEAQLGTNSSNSSVPPSANPLGARKPVVKKKSKRKPGGQPGHPPRLKQLLPPERVNETHCFVPKECAKCRAVLPTEAQPGDAEPTRFQTIELPPVVARVTEYQGHARTCPRCGHITKEAVPQQFILHSVGPRLTATLSYFAGCHGNSKRAIEEIAEVVFAAPVCLG